MGRPQKQTVDYFPHYATSGKTLFILENKFGNDGYAFWFKLLELLGATEGHCFRVGNEVDWEFLLAKTKVSAETASEILNTLANLDAIDRELWSERVIWSQKFVDNLSEVYKKRKISAPKKPSPSSFRVENAIENEVAEITDSETLQSKVKESKGKESRVEEGKGKEINNDDAADNEKANGTQAVEFAEKAWGRPITEIEIESIIKWCDEFGTRGSPDPDALVIESIKKAIDQNVRKLAYVNGILQDWFDNGITSLEHIASRDAEWKAQKDKGKGPKDPKGPKGTGKYDNFYL